MMRTALNFMRSTTTSADAERHACSLSVSSVYTRSSPYSETRILPMRGSMPLGAWSSCATKQSLFLRRRGAWASSSRLGDSERLSSWCKSVSYRGELR